MHAEPRAEKTRQKTGRKGAWFVSAAGTVAAVLNFPRTLFGTHFAPVCSPTILQVPDMYTLVVETRP